MYPVLAKTLSEAHCKGMISSVIRIDFDAKRISVGQSESISCEFHWACAVVGVAILSDCAIINFECSVAMQHILISEIDLTEL